MPILQFPNDISQEKITNLTKEITSLLEDIQQKPISPLQKNKIFHQQTLKSSLFSARIEGNKLTLIQAQNINLKNSKGKSKIEINNILKIIQNIDKLPTHISSKTITFLHKKILDKIDHHAGKFRNETSGIFDGTGNIVYITPDPNEMKQMIEILIKKINQPSNNNVGQLYKIAQCHYYFEKIHPFTDGNGRVGRSLLQYQLQKTELFFDYILPIDQYFEKHRSDYYYFLEKNTKNIDKFIIFFLKGIIFSLKEIISIINNLQPLNNFTQSISKQNSHLLPRRQELINIIEDHPYISLDSLSRRFPTIPRRTIAYDVNYLVKNKLVNKYGKTRGVRYSIPTPVDS